MPVQKISRKEYLLSKILVNPETGCWEWQGYIMPKGYAQACFHSVHALAHVAMYEELVGPVPEGLILDHTCHDWRVCEGGKACPHRRCANPDHLEPVTYLENNRRSNSNSAKQGRQTHCKHDHPLSGENLRIGPDGKRICRQCASNRKRSPEYQKWQYAYYRSERYKELEEKRKRRRT